MNDTADVTLREHLETVHGGYVTAHHREHEAHAAAHEREHQLNKDAIDKAEHGVDRAVSAAKETMDKSLDALVARMDRSEAEQRRRLEEMSAGMQKMGLDIATQARTIEGNSKLIQAIQDSQTWIVRLIVGAIVLAIMAWIIRPAVF